MDERRLGPVMEGREQFRRQLEWYDAHVEIEQIHNLALWREQLEWLVLERDAGRIGRLGVTHYLAGALPELAEALRTETFQTVQVPYNPHEGRASGSCCRSRRSSESR